MGILVVIVSIPKYEVLGFNNEHWLWLPMALLTFPNIIVLFALVYVDTSISLLIVLQIAMLLIYWRVLYFFLKRK